MTWNPNHDRDYWRCTPDADLIDAAMDSGHELAIALGERLDGLTDVDERLTEALNDVKRLEAERDTLRRLVTEYEAANDPA